MFILKGLFTIFGTVLLLDLKILEVKTYHSYTERQNFFAFDDDVKLFLKIQIKQLLEDNKIARNTTWLMSPHHVCFLLFLAPAGHFLTFFNLTLSKHEKKR